MLGRNVGILHHGMEGIELCDRTAVLWSHSLNALIVNLTYVELLLARNLGLDQTGEESRYLVASLRLLV